MIVTNGTRVHTRRFGEGMVIGYIRRDEILYLVQFDKSNQKLHNGFLQSPQEPLRGKEGHCWYCVAEDFHVIDDMTFEGNV